MWWRCDSGGRSRWLWTTATRSRAKVQRVLCLAVRGWCRWLLTEYGCLSDGASPDLNPLDYFLWGHLKSLVYTIPIENENDLRNRIVASCEAIRNTPGIFERARQSLRRRLDGCIMVQGGHFHLIVLFR
ncbi:hypothetical protein ALC57_12900 [Trachymyrmex cornetzi]|uniref:Uncharacterized protein n=1 Tax=Trachymyrmex cornetzi TaxID=471704 RepID=A0A151J071_9HYME|nr:hypothetical protein ALC57_12900 [Trachymyrmex cornetzi]